MKTACPLIALVLTVALPLTGCRGDRPPAALEEALLAGDWAKVETLAGEWMDGDGFRRVGSVLRGYAALARGDASAAANHFLRGRALGSARSDHTWAEKLGAEHSERPTAQLVAGDALARRGMRKASLERLDAALQLDTQLHVARLARAMLRALDGDRSAALQDLNALVTGGDLVAEALVTRALVKLEADDLEEALNDIDHAIALAPDHAPAHNVRGVIYGRRGDWETATREFEAAFRLLPELEEARQNWRLAQAAHERGATISGQWHLGVFGTGIRSEADIDYARDHARDLMPGRPQSFLYVGIQGNLPLAGVDKAAAQGLTTVVVNPRDPQEGMLKIDQFIGQSMAQGRNPVVVVDINKWAPTQLGNNKAEAMGLPADIAVRARATFQNEVTLRGATASPSTVAAHSDFTWVAAQASIKATQGGVPFSSVVLESPRSEKLVQEAVRLSPNTQFTAIQPKGGDLWTAEAQGRGLLPGAYQKTIDTLKGIDASNYRAAIVENPTSFGLGVIPRAHGDSANYNRFSDVTFWRGGTQIGAASGPLGQVVTQPRGMQSEAMAPAVNNAPGGITIGPVVLRRGAGGRVSFQSGDSKGELSLVYTLFGSNELVAGGVQ